MRHSLYIYIYIYFWGGPIARKDTPTPSDPFLTFIYPGLIGSHVFKDCLHKPSPQLLLNLGAVTAKVWMAPGDHRAIVSDCSEGTLSDLDALNAWVHLCLGFGPPKLGFRSSVGFLSNHRKGGTLNKKTDDSEGLMSKMPRLAHFRTSGLATKNVTKLFVHHLNELRGSESKGGKQRRHKTPNWAILFDNPPPLNCSCTPLPSPP